MSQRDGQASTLVSTDWLLPRLGQAGLAVLDVRWALPEGADRAGYLEAHIPGAAFIDLERDLAGPAGPAGRHPLPSPDQFAKAMRRAGVDEDSTVVAYDGGTGAAARAWWLLHASGHVRAAVLDGGWDGWRGRGHPTVMGEEASRGGTFRAHDFEGWVGADELAALLRRGEVVLDARSHERYLGQPSPLDPRPGHVPGATNLPWSDAYARGLVRSADELSRLLRDAGRGRVPAAAYCGSGVTACSLILALASAGVEGVRLYPGSWSEWAQDPGRPAETGEGVSRGG